MNFFLMKNKRFLTAMIVAMFVFSAVTFAQVSFGAKVGTNLSNVYDTSDEQMQADPKFGLALGGFMTVPIVQFLALQPEILFSQKGFQGSGTLLGTNYSFARTTNYIDIPILLAIRPSEMFSVLVGPQYSYLMSQKYVFNSILGSSLQEDDFNNENIRRNTLCLTGGADINFDKMVFGLRAGFDLMNNNGDGTSNTPRYKNLWYQATIGYKF